MQRNAHIPQERHRLAAILGDFDDDLSEKATVGRKVDAINAMVAYGFVPEPLVRARLDGADRHRNRRQLQTLQPLQCLDILGRPSSPPPPYSAVDPRGTLIH